MIKKCAVCVWILVCLFTMAACGQQKEQGGNIQDTISGSTYLYEKEGFGGNFTIQIHEDGTFQYYEGLLSSYIGMGAWTLEDDILVLSDDDLPFVNRFQVDGDDLSFLAEDSSNFLYVEVAGGEKFTIMPEEA